MYEEKESLSEDNASVNIYDVSENYNLVKNAQIDFIGDRYKIQLSNQIQELNNYYSQAYEIENLRNAEDKTLYAAILSKNFPIRLPVINHLKKNLFENLLSPIECEVTTLSNTNQQNVVVILPKPPALSLRQLVQTRGKCSANFINNNVLVPIARLLNKFSRYNIVHGKINPDNIFINQNGNIVIGECVTESCGYGQQSFYEPLERTECLNFGKGSGDITVDYFALGVLCLYLFLGKDLQNTPDLEALTRLRYEEGTFRAYIGTSIIPSNFKDLLKGLLTDKDSERWKIKQILEWSNSKRYTLPIEDNIEATKQLVFNNKRYVNPKYIAHDLFKYWDLGKKFLREDKLIKWVERGLNNIYIYEKLTHILNSSQISSYGRNSDDKNEGIVKVISTLDPVGPIRIQDFAIHLDSIGNLIAFGFAEGKNEYLEFAVKIIQLNLWRGVIDTRRYEKKSFFYNLLGWLDNCRNYIENKMPGYGLERCLYELNRFYPCQSVILVKEYVTSLTDLLNGLENEASNIEAEIIDRHIAAYIMSRIEVDYDKILSPLKRYPDFYNNRDIKNLALLAIAQRETGIRKLPNICKLNAERLVSITELLNNSKTKEKIKKKIENIANEGVLSVILKFILDTEYIREDKENFKEAERQYAKLEQQKVILNDDDKIYEIGYRYGLKLTVIISYLLCTVIFILLLSRL
ncbi:MAG: hypothetical protein ACK4OM_01860 [Alphaproteobacteria bacterium]